MEVFIFILIIAKCIIAKSFLTRSLGGNVFLTKSSGRMIMVPAPARNGRPNTITILWYAKDPKNYVFNYEEIERIPYMAPGLVGEEKARRGKLPTDTWWHTIVGTNSKEKTGYPTQKPLGVIRRIIQASSNPGDTVLDFFAGSGTTGAACLELGRNFILIDNNPSPLQVMAKRFEKRDGIEWVGFNPLNYEPT